MTENAIEEELLQDDERPKKKRRIPTWLVAGCSIGCIGVILLTVVSAIALKDLMDPEKQWPKLQRALHYEEQPEELQMAVGIPIPGVMSSFTLTDRAGRFVANVMIFQQGLSANERDQLFSEDGTEVPFGMLQPVDAVADSALVQGREVSTLSFSKVKGAGAITGPTMRFDVTAEGGSFRMVELRFLQDCTEQQRLEMSAEFFANFDVWHGEEPGEEGGDEPAGE